MAEMLSDLKLKAIREALEFYGRPDNYIPPDSEALTTAIEDDGGALAREVLETL